MAFLYFLSMAFETPGPQGQHSRAREIRKMQACMRAKLLQSCLTLCDPMDRSPQAPLSTGFSRQEYWSGLLCSSAGDLPNPGIEPVSLMSTCIDRQVLYYLRHLGSPQRMHIRSYFSQPENDTFAHSPLVRTGHMAPCLMTEKVGKYTMRGGGSTWTLWKWQLSLP